MEEKEVCYHVPVMLHESLEGLDIQPSGVYVDVTFGGGGHSREILNRLNDEGELYGFDQDADAEKNIPADSRFVFVRSNFRYLYNFMRYHGVAGEVDGLLADLGVSSKKSAIVSIFFASRLRTKTEASLRATFNSP